MVADSYPGIDIVVIQRIRTLLTSNHSQQFINRTFTSKEKEYCQSKPDSAIHFAGRFAAKEAIKKCIMSSGEISIIAFKDIEILPNELGAPVVNIVSESLNEYKCRVSISHDGEYAIANAIFTL